MIALNVMAKDMLSSGVLIVTVKEKSIAKNAKVRDMSVAPGAMQPAMKIVSHVVAAVVLNAIHVMAPVTKDAQVAEAMAKIFMAINVHGVGATDT